MMAVRKKTIKILSLLKVAMYILATIGLVMVIRRLLVLTGYVGANNKPGFSSFDQGFGKHSFITILHIVPGALFMILGPLQFITPIRLKHSRFHRRSGRVFFLAAYTIGISSIILSFVKQPVGGMNEAVASVFYAIFFLLCISLSLHYSVNNQVPLHREWMIRAFSIGLAIATVWLITVLVFVFFHVLPQNFLGTAFWMGFTLHAMIAEMWINYTRIPVAGKNEKAIVPQ